MILLRISAYIFIVLPFSCAVRNTAVLEVPKTTPRFKDTLEVSKDSACSHTHGANLLQREDMMQSQPWESHGIQT